MAGGEDEAVAARPVRVGRVVAQHVAVEEVGERRERHRRARMARVRLLHRVHRERADRVDRLGAGVRGHHREHIAAAPRLPYARVGPDRIQPPQGALGRPALRRGLVLGRPRAAARARGAERRRQDDAAARDHRRDDDPGRRDRAAEGRAGRAPRSAPAARPRADAPRVRALGRRRPRRDRAGAAASSSRRWRAAPTTTRRCAATARRRRGSSTPAAGTGATAPPRCCAGSASAITTSTGSSTTFSGGELTRASLGRTLAGDPDLLLLDEPTNHLDVDSLEWLERELTSIDAAVVLVAHDRWFLESVTTAVLELEGGRGLYFSGPWHQWRLERAARAHAAAKSVQRVGADIERLERFVARFRYKKSKAKQAQAKLTQIGRLEKERKQAARRAREPHAPPAHDGVRVPQAGAHRPDRRRDGGPAALRRRQAADRRRARS